MITDQNIRELEEFIRTVKPLYVEIKTEVRIVPENETTCKRGGQFCLLFYSESKEGYLQTEGCADQWAGFCYYDLDCQNA